MHDHLPTPVTAPSHIIPIGETRAGEHDVYTIIDNYDSYDMRGVVVADSAGSEHYVTFKSPEVQVAVSRIGAYLVAHGPASLGRLQFPDIRTDTFNGRKAALVSYFRGYTELPDHDPDRRITEDERGFLAVFNAFVGNTDYKPEHVLLPKSGDGPVGLIDFEKSLDFGHEDLSRYNISGFELVGIPDAAHTDPFADMMSRLSPEDWRAVRRMVVDAGYEEESAAAIVGSLQARAANIQDIIQQARMLAEGHRDSRRRAAAEAAASAYVQRPGLHT